MLQAAVCDCGPLDTSAFCEDGVRSAEVDVSGRAVVDALMISDVIAVLDEGVDLIVVEQNAVLQGLMPALDLSLGLGMIWGAAIANRYAMNRSVNLGSSRNTREKPVWKSDRPPPSGPISTRGVNATSHKV